MAGPDLTPSIVQDADDGRVLMLAWMDEEALRRTWETGEAWFWSRSRGELWHKGESSGNSLAVVELRDDCDGDAILLRVRPAGPVCHTGSLSCFAPWLWRRIAERARERPEGSYVVRLLDEGAAAAARKTYQTLATSLSKSRKEAAKRLDQDVAGELGPLKLEKASFITNIETVDLAEGGTSGIDRVAFWVRTNPGTEPAPLMKVASGGELARFILALKVVLAARGSAPTLVFDEADAGVGGATAAAVGERLSRLAARVQVLAVTHAPQVAAVASGHLLIAKEPVRGPEGEAMATRVAVLEGEHRREEIARMLAGQTITDEARKAAERLMSRSA